VPLIAPTPSAFRSPNPNTVLSFLTPSTDADLDKTSTNASGTSSLNASMSSPHKTPHNLSFNSCDSPRSNEASAEKKRDGPGASRHHGPNGTITNIHVTPTMNGTRVTKSSSRATDSNQHTPQQMDVVATPSDTFSTPTVAGVDGLAIVGGIKVGQLGRRVVGRRRSLAPPPIGGIGRRASLARELDQKVMEQIRAEQIKINGAGQNGSSANPEVDRPASTITAKRRLLVPGVNPIHSAEAYSSSSPLTADLSLPPHSAPLSFLNANRTSLQSLDAEDALHLEHGEDTDVVDDDDEVDVGALQQRSNSVSLMDALNSAAAMDSEKKHRHGRVEDGEGVDDDIVQANGHSLHSPPAATNHLSTSTPPGPISLLSPLLDRATAATSTAHSSTSTSRTSPGHWATEIIPNLYLGSARHAASLPQLRAHHVTHIINVADDVDNFFEALVIQRDNESKVDDGTDNGMSASSDSVTVPEFEYFNCFVRDGGYDRGISRVFDPVYKWLMKAGFRVDHAGVEEMRRQSGINAWPEVNGSRAASNPASTSMSSSFSSSSSSSSSSRPCVVLIHCHQGANRSVTLVLALLLLLFPHWSLDACHRWLVDVARYPDVTPFVDSRRELMRFERKKRGGINSMNDKDFRTRFARDEL